MTIGFSLLLAVVFGALAVGGQRELVPPKAFYGMRTEATMRSDDAWMAAHREAAPANFVAAACFAATALGAGLFASSARSESLIAVIGWVAGLAAVGVAVYLGQRAAGTFEAEASDD